MGIRRRDRVHGRSPRRPGTRHRDRARSGATRRGQADEALRGIDEILARLGPVVTLQLTAIDIEVHRGDMDGALRRIDAAMTTTPRNEGWLELRGDILMCAGRAAEARQAYTAALEAMASLPPERRATRAVADRERRLRMAL